MLAWFQVDLIGGLGSALNTVLSGANLLLLGVGGGIFYARHRRMERDISKLWEIQNGDTVSVVGVKLTTEIQGLRERIERHAGRLSEMSARLDRHSEVISKL